jgi:hypothetical protein
VSRKVVGWALLAIFVVGPIVLFDTTGSPVGRVERLDVLAHQPLAHLPIGVWRDLLVLALWAIVTWMWAGLLAESVSRTVAKRFRSEWLGLSGRVAEGIFSLVSSEDPAVAWREGVLSGAVPAPVDVVLAERRRIQRVLEDPERYAQGVATVRRSERLPRAWIPEWLQRDPSAGWWLRLALAGAEVPILTATAKADALYLRLMMPAEMPQPWEAIGSSGLSWRMERSGDPKRLLARSGVPAPMSAFLVPLLFEDNEVPIFVDLVSLGGACSVANRAMLDQAVRGLVLMPWLTQVEIVALGGRGTERMPADLRVDDLDAELPTLQAPMRRLVLSGKALGASRPSDALVIAVADSSMPEIDLVGTLRWRGKVVPLTDAATLALAVPPMLGT